MPTCPTCRKWITRSDLRTAEGAGAGAPRNRCPTDGTILALTEPLPPGPARPQRRLSLGDVTALALVVPLVYLLMAGAVAPWVAVLIAGAGLALTWLTGQGLFAFLGIAAAALMLAGGWVLRHYEA